MAMVTCVEGFLVALFASVKFLLSAGYGGEPFVD